MTATTVTPATPCPPFCTTPHEDPEGRFHYSDFAWTGNVGVNVEISDTGKPSVGVSLGHDPQHLDLAEVDALIKRLQEKRDLLAGLAEHRAAPSGEPRAWPVSWHYGAAPGFQRYPSCFLLCGGHADGSTPGVHSTDLGGVLGDYVIVGQRDEEPPYVAVTDVPGPEWEPDDPRELALHLLQAADLRDRLAIPIPGEAITRALAELLQPGDTA